MQQRAPFRRIGAIALGGAVSFWAGCAGDDEIAAPAPPSPGVVEVRTATTGQEIDPDGYTVSLDGGAGQAVAVNGAVAISGLDAGDHELDLSGVAANCAVNGTNPRTVIVTAGATARTTFQVSCAATTVISVVSGQDQKGKPGETLAEPFVIRVTDGKGVEAADVDVTWRVVRGEGSLQGGFDENGGPVRATTTRTDAEGLAEVAFMPTQFGPIETMADVAGVERATVTFRTDATDPEAQLTIVSGGDQDAKAGQQLGQPFVVKVTNGQGDPVPHMAVHWGITYGDGDFGLDELGNRERFPATRTNAEGRAAVTLTPTWFGPVDVSASVVGVDGPAVSFTVDATDDGAKLNIVSGNEQEGKAGEALPEPFVVRVTDGQGDVAANVLVSWSVTQGLGSWEGVSDEASPYSDSNGMAPIGFSPQYVGTIGVTAQLAGTHVRVGFTTYVSVFVITYVDYYSWGGFFVGPYCENSSCSVPIGTTVEWVNALPDAAHIVSTSTPPDGASFDSGTLNENGRFQFVPNVAGTWAYVDQLTGRTGILNVH